MAVTRTVNIKRLGRQHSYQTTESSENRRDTAGLGGNVRTGPWGQPLSECKVPMTPDLIIPMMSVHLRILRREGIVGFF